MKTEVINRNNTEIAVVSSDELLITDVQSALDLIMTVKYETGCSNIAINIFDRKACLQPEKPQAESKYPFLYYSRT